MLVIRIEPKDQAQLRAGDVRVLKAVLEEEADRQRKVLVEQVNVESFRFQQGQIQTLEAVMKLLP